MDWFVGPLIGSPAAITAVISLRRIKFTIEEIHFATPLAGGDYHYLYKESSSHAIALGDLKKWGIGSKITVPEWTRSTKERYRACFTRQKPITMRVKIRINDPLAIKAPLKLRLWQSPKLDDSRKYLKRSSKEFTLSPGVTDEWVTIKTAGKLPNEIGRYVLKITWRLTSPNGKKIYRLKPQRTRNRIYGIYNKPLVPSYDSSSIADTGTTTSSTMGTLTGTKKRLDHLMRIIGSNSRRCKVSSPSRIINLYWKLHKGINNTPGAPPHFDASHDEHMTVDGNSDGTDIALKDQWLSWVKTTSSGATDPSDKHWNDISCIGHVQLFKTMVAAVGLFARRTWIFPHTKKKPDGTTFALSDTDLYSLGNYDSSKKQTWSFTYGATTYTAVCKLMEPDNEWENFEACMKTPNGKFLTGGYPTRANPRYMRRNKGFSSAAQLIKWWSSTSRTRWKGHRIRRFKRFLAWVYYNRATGEEHYWDVNGTYYDKADYQNIRNSGKKLPPP